MTVSIALQPANGRQAALRELAPPAIPELPPREQFNLKAVRAPGERLYGSIVWLAIAIVLLFPTSYALMLVVATVKPELFPEDTLPSIWHGLIILVYCLGIWFFWWVGAKLAFARIQGHCIEVTAHQFPQVYGVVRQASHFLGIRTPRIFIMQGHGIFDLFVSRVLTRRGCLVISSNMMDEFAKKPSSREMMMFVGRQLGHLKAGHFRFWFLKNTIGLLANVFYFAWWRRCHKTADRIGLLCAGELYAAEQGLLMLAVGAKLAPGASLDALEEQRDRVRSSFWCWLDRTFSRYPHMVDRIHDIRQFAASIGLEGFVDDRRLSAHAGKISGISALPIQHTPLRSLPVLVIHGHDRMALLELQTLLYSKFPNIAPRVMQSAQHGALSMAEKFEEVTGDLIGAIALVTPDDLAMPLREPTQQQHRARQNVVMEIGWVWGRLGRRRCLLLKRGQVELPSDLSGVEARTFHESPSECLDAVQAFIAEVASREMGQRGNE